MGLLDRDWYNEAVKERDGINPKKTKTSWRGNPELTPSNNEPESVLKHWTYALLFWVSLLLLLVKGYNFAKPKIDQHRQSKLSSQVITPQELGACSVDGYLCICTNGLGVRTIIEFDGCKSSKVKNQFKVKPSV